MNNQINNPNKGVTTMRRTPKMLKGLRDVCRSIHPDNRGLMVEIGSFMGESASVFADYFDHVICVDPLAPYDGDRAGKDLENNYQTVFDSLSIVRRVKRNVSHLQLTGNQAAKLLHNAGGIDFVYIDGMHTEDAVRNDLMRWHRIARYIGGHDYCDDDRFQGVVKAVDEWHDSHAKDTTLNTFVDGSWLIDQYESNPLPIDPIK